MHSLDSEVSFPVSEDLVGLTSVELLRMMTRFNLPSKPAAVNQDLQSQGDSIEEAAQEIANLSTVHILLENLNRYWKPSTYAGQCTNLNKFRDWNAFLDGITNYDNIFPND